MATAYINLGSNIGDRRSTIERAVSAIEADLGASARRSQWVESEPWGFDSPNRFVNLGIAVDMELEPIELLRRLQAVEKSIDPSAHRDAEGRYIDRVIDIDLIAVDHLVVDTPELTLPHPRMKERPFVMGPLLELCPDWL